MITGYTNVSLEIKLGRFSGERFATVTLKKMVWKIPIFVNQNKDTAFRFQNNTSGFYNYKCGDLKGNFFLNPYEGKNVLFKKGTVRIRRGSKYFSYADGSPFFWFSDTWWYASTKRMRWPKIFKRVVKNRKGKGFTVAQLVIGAPPEVKVTSVEATNDGGSVFVKNNEINPAYFEEIDKKIKFLISQEIVPCMFGGWGNNSEILGKEKIEILWREVIARYASYPVIFVLCGEVDGLIPKNVFPGKRVIHKIFKIFLTRNFSKLLKNAQLILYTFSNVNSTQYLKKRVSFWNNMAIYIKKINPFANILGAHVTSINSAWNIFDKPEWLDFNSIQSGHDLGRRSSIVTSILSDKSDLPFINLEPWYEGILNNFNEVDQRYAFWMSILSGAAGCSYGADGLWQMRAENDSFLDHWGNGQWDKALKYQGAASLGHAKKFLMKFEWWKLKSDLNVIKPHFEEKHPNYPMAAKIADKYIFIYFPNSNQRFYTLRINNKIKYRIKSYDPTKMLVLETSTIENESLFRIKKKSTGDLVLLIENLTFKKKGAYVYN